MRHKIRLGTHRSLVGNHLDELAGIIHIKTLLLVVTTLIHTNMVEPNLGFGYADGVKSGQHGGKQQSQAQSHPPTPFFQLENHQERRDHQHGHKLDGILERNAPKHSVGGKHFLCDKRNQHQQIIGFQQSKKHSRSQGAKIELSFYPIETRQRTRVVKQNTQGLAWIQDQILGNLSIIVTQILVSHDSPCPNPWHYHHVDHNEINQCKNGTAKQIPKRFLVLTVIPHQA